MIWCADPEQTALRSMLGRSMDNATNRWVAWGCGTKRRIDKLTGQDNLRLLIKRGLHRGQSRRQDGRQL